jgi:F-type H+-transporting ATPase subunit c
VAFDFSTVTAIVPMIADFNEAAAKRLGAGLAMGFGAIGPGIGIGIAVGGAVQGISRNPEALGDIRATMIIGAALSEAVAIYALVIALVLAFT